MLEWRAGKCSDGAIKQTLDVTFEIINVAGKSRRPLMTADEGVRGWGGGVERGGGEVDLLSVNV